MPRVTVSKYPFKKLVDGRVIGNAGGEEFEIGHRITQSEKKIVLIKEAFYSNLLY